MCCSVFILYWTTGVHLRSIFCMLWSQCIHGTAIHAICRVLRTSQCISELCSWYCAAYCFNISRVHYVLWFSDKEDPNQFKTGCKQCWKLDLIREKRAHIHWRDFSKQEVCWFEQFSNSWWGERDIKAGLKWYSHSNEGGAREPQQPRHAYLKA